QIQWALSARCEPLDAAADIAAGEPAGPRKIPACPARNEGDRRTVNGSSARVHVRLAHFVERPIPADDGDQGGSALDGADRERRRMSRLPCFEDLERRAERFETSA